MYSIILKLVNNQMTEVAVIDKDVCEETESLHKAYEDGK